MEKEQDKKYSSVVEQFEQLNLQDHIDEKISRIRIYENAYGK